MNTPDPATGGPVTTRVLPRVRLRLPAGGGCEAYDTSGIALLDRFDSLAEAELAFSGDQLALDGYTGGLALADEIIAACADLAGQGWAIDIWCDRIAAATESASRVDLIAALAAMAARTHATESPAGGPADDQPAPAQAHPPVCPAADAWGRSTS